MLAMHLFVPSGRTHYAWDTLQPLPYRDNKLQINSAQFLYRRNIFVCRHSQAIDYPIKVNRAFLTHLYLSD
jgi:hypothetical protein